MKTAIHPEYRSVVFRDASADFSFLTRSTRTSDKRVTWEDGREYPVIDVEVSSASPPLLHRQGDRARHRRPGREVPSSLREVRPSAGRR